MSESAVSEDISFLSEADDEFFFRSPFFMDFDLAAVYEVDAVDFFTFLEDEFSFFEVEGFAMCFDGGYPFGQTSFAKEAAFEVAILVIFLHVQRINVYFRCNINLPNCN